MRPIDADAAVVLVENCLPELINRQALSTFLKMLPVIKSKHLQPHGHWIEHPTGGLVCSVCERYKPDEWRSMCCPNCGAILDGQVECDG